MRIGVIVCAVAILCATVPQAKPQTDQTAPDRFTIGRHTFIDVGPPNDYYEILSVTPSAGGSQVTKVTLTPVIDVCFMPAKIEMVSGSLPSSPRDLLGAVNPCAIPKKELTRELKRCKDCLVFSGEDVAMQVQCGDQTRIVRSKVLDKDMFDPNPHTPEHTSWTMQLLDRLDQAVGPGVLDQPIFPALANDTTPVQSEASAAVLQDIRSGKYDSLFQDTPDKPSGLYHAAQVRPVIPTVRLESSTPFQPISFALPKYPVIPKVAHVQGAVSVSFEVNTKGGVTNVSFESGPPLLRASVKDAVSAWTFPEDASGKQIRATIVFDLNCPEDKFK